VVGHRDPRGWIRARLRGGLLLRRVPHLLLQRQPRMPRQGRLLVLQQGTMYSQNSLYVPRQGRLANFFWQCLLACLVYDGLSE
jgi:hypothetical protein